MSVLIVDDEADVRETLRDVFEDHGFEVRVAANGAEAIAALERVTTPCAVVLDLVMPVLDGHAVYAAIEALAERRPPTGCSGAAPFAVVICTSDPGHAPAGALVMKKPVDLHRLLETVQRMLLP